MDYLLVKKIFTTTFIVYEREIDKNNIKQCFSMATITFLDGLEVESIVDKICYSKNFPDKLCVVINGREYIAEDIKEKFDATCFSKEFAENYPCGFWLQDNYVWVMCDET